MATSLYLFLMYLIPVVLGMAILSASAYGLGKNEKDMQSIEYKASLVFFILGLVVTTGTVTLWIAGNFSTVSKDDLTNFGRGKIEELDNCITELNQLKKLNEEAKLAQIVKS